MGEYAQELWFPVAIALTGLGVLISIILWRRRGIGSGLRGFAWSLLPIAAYLLGVLDLIIPFAFRVVRWALHLVFSLGSYIGLALLGLSVVLWIISSVIIGRRQAVAAGEQKSRVAEPKTGKALTERSDSTAVTRATAGSDGDDDDMADIQDILKKHGIS